MGALEALVDPLTRGDPTSPLRWTCTSRAKLTAALTEHGWRVSSTTVGPAAALLGLPAAVGAQTAGRRHAPGPQRAVRTHQPDRRQVSDLGRAGHLGQHEEEGTGGQLRQPGPGMAAERGHRRVFACTTSRPRPRAKAIPCGVYDMARNEARVSVGRDHDTPAFAVASIRHWWRKMGRGAYPKATRLYVTADAGREQRVSVPRLEARASAVRGSDRPDHRGEPFPTRHEQVKQGRAPALLPHHGELGRHPAGNLGDDRRSHREHLGRLPGSGSAPFWTRGSIRRV